MQERDLIQLAALLGVGYYLVVSGDVEDADDENFKKGFAIGWVTPGPLTLLVLGSALVSYWS